MVFQDKTLVCQDCGGDFVFSVGEQSFYSEKGFQNDPKRCPDCRSKNKKKSSQGGGGNSSGGKRQMYSVTCAECGRETQVPFEPTQGRPVLCRDCFKTSRPRY